MRDAHIAFEEPVFHFETIVVKWAGLEVCWWRGEGFFVVVVETLKRMVNSEPDTIW